MHLKIKGGKIIKRKDLNKLLFITHSFIWLQRKPGEVLQLCWKAYEVFTFFDSSERSGLSSLNRHQETRLGKIEVSRFPGYTACAIRICWSTARLAPMLTSAFSDLLCTHATRWKKIQCGGLARWSSFAVRRWSDQQRCVFGSSVHWTEGSSGSSRCHWTWLMNRSPASPFRPTEISAQEHERRLSSRHFDAHGDCQRCRSNVSLVYPLVYPPWHEFWLPSFHFFTRDLAYV